MHFKQFFIESFIKKVMVERELEEASRKGVEKYWISPGGKPHHIHGMHHTEWALRNVLKKKGYDRKPENLVWDNDIMEKMTNSGWVRVAVQRKGQTDKWGLHMDIVVDAKRNSGKSRKALDEIVWDVADGPENIEYITGEVRQMGTPIMMGQEIDFDGHKYKVIGKYF